MQQLGQLTGPAAGPFRQRGQELELGNRQRVLRVGTARGAAQRSPQPGNPVCQLIGFGAAAGRQYREMLAAGASRPWQDTLRRFAGTDRVDAAALLEYFAPLREWLAQENAGRTCGWTEPSALATGAGPQVGSGLDQPGENQ